MFNHEGHEGHEIINFSGSSRPSWLNFLAHDSYSWIFAVNTNPKILCSMFTSSLIPHPYFDFSW